MNLYAVIVSLSILIDIYGVYEVICYQQYSDKQSEKARKNQEFQNDDNLQSFEPIDTERDDAIEDSHDVYGRENPFLLYKSFTNYMSEEDIELNDLTSAGMEEDDEFVVKKRVARDASPSNNRGRDRERERRRRTGRRGPRPRTTVSPVVNRNERADSRLPRHQSPQRRQPDQPKNETCYHCMWREERKNLRLATIKQDILRKVQMAVPPNHTHYPREPVDVLMGERVINESFLRDQQEEPKVEEAADRTQIVTFSEPPPPSLQLFNKSIFDPKDVIYFKLQQDILKSRLHLATLYIYAKKYNYPPGSVKHLRVYRIIERRYHEDYRYAPEPDVSKKISLTPEETGKWIQLNLTAVVEKWMSPCHHQGCQYGYENYGLYVSFKDFHSNNIAVIKPQTTEEENYNPWLKVVKYEAQTSRKRRQHPNQAKDCDEHSNEEMCCRYNLNVDFEEIGWNHWILVPKSFNAFFCSGKCDLSISGSSYAHLVSLAKNGQTGGPCCTPSSMESLSILYFDNLGRFQSTVIENMVAKSCSCN